VVIMVGGCASTLAVLAWQHPNRVTLPAPTGPHAVGRVFLDWADGERTDPLAFGSGTPRDLPVWIWYPAAQGAASPPTDYLPPLVVSALEEAALPLFRGTLGRLMTHPSNVEAHSLDGPPVVDGTFPVVLMWPLRGGLAPQYAVLAEDLASHGYVVVGADTPHTTRVAVYPDGRVSRRTEAGAPSESAVGPTSPFAPGVPNALFLPVLDVLVDDGAFLATRLERLSSEDPRFAGRLDLAAVGAFGHSVGGTAALAFCAAHAQCRAGINIDGYLMGPVVRTGLDKPFLFVWSDRPIFRKTPAELTEPERTLLDALASIRAGLPNSVQQVILEGSGHYNFGDAALLTSSPFARATGSIGSIDPQRGLQVTRGYVRAFFDVHLKAKPEAALADLRELYPEGRLD
jgi:hypothetical protein